MTGELAYQSSEEFEPDYKAEIAAEVEALAQDYSWWRDPIVLSDDPQRPYTLTGSSKIMRRLINIESQPPSKVKYRDDVLLGMVDYMSIVEILTMLSLEHETSWNLSYPTASRPKPIGSIDNGKIGASVFDFLMPEMDALEISASELDDKALHSDLREKYMLR